MNWQWTYIERTLNMQWTRHRTLRKLRERANPWKSKENSIFVLFSENHHQLHRFAAICSFLDCVQCVFNVAFTVCSLYVQCQLQWQAPWDLILQETMHVCNPVRPNLSRHTTYLDTTDWPGLFPSYLFLGAGAWSMVACSDWVCCMWIWPAGRKEKNAFPRRYPEQSALSLQRLQRQSCKGGNQNTACYAVTLPAPSFTHLILSTTGTTRSQWTDSERTLNVHWTCSERGIEHWENWGKERIRGNRKKIQYLCFFLKITINCTDLLLFAAFWTVFNVCSMLRSLYVHCMFNVSFSGRRPET